MKAFESCLRFVVLGLLVATTSPATAADEPRVVGWRGDRSGTFPNADPVTEFTESENVLWKTPMPQWANSSPIVVGGRVFVTSEPDELLCLDADDGKILWRKSSTHLDLLPRDDAAAARQAWEREWAFERERNVLLYELNQLKARAKASPDDAAAQRALEDFRKTLAARELDLDQNRGDFADRSPKRGEQEKRRRVLEKKYGLYFETWMRWDYWIGHAMPTPTSDGAHVWVHFGSNTVACYDLDGNRRWMKWFDRGFDKQSKAAGDPYWNAYPRALFVASPLLVGDTLVVQSGRALRGLDAATGEQRWQQDIDRYFEYAVGSPVHMNVAGTDVVITAFGDVRRLADGHLLASNVGYSPNGASPTIHGDVVYFENGANPGGQVPNVRFTIAAVRINPAGPDAVSAETVWSAKSQGGYVSPIYHDVLLYHVDEGHLTVRDAKDGKVVNKPVPINEEYAQLTLAGKYLFVSDCKGRFTVWTAGRETTLVAKNELKADEPVGAKLEQRKQVSGDMHWQFMFGLPFFQGDRMYVRSYDNVYCVGRE